MLKLNFDKVKILLCHGVDTEVMNDVWELIKKYVSSLSLSLNMYIVCGNTDLRKGIDTLAILLPIILV